MENKNNLENNAQVILKNCEIFIKAITEDKWDTDFDHNYMNETLEALAVIIFQEKNKSLLSEEFPQIGQFMEKIEGLFGERENIKEHLEVLIDFYSDTYPKLDNEETQQTEDENNSLLKNRLGEILEEQLPSWKSPIPKGLNEFLSPMSVYDEGNNTTTIGLFKSLLKFFLTKGHFPVDFSNEELKRTQERFAHVLNLIDPNKRNSYMEKQTRRLMSLPLETAKRLREVLSIEVNDRELIKMVSAMDEYFKERNMDFTTLELPIASESIVNATAISYIDQILLHSRIPLFGNSFQYCGIDVSEIHDAIEKTASRLIAMEELSKQGENTETWEHQENNELMVKVKELNKLLKNRNMEIPDLRKFSANEPLTSYRINERAPYLVRR